MIKPSICLVAHFAYGAISGGRSGHVGGVERQTSLMAKWLVERGYRVSLVTWAENGDVDEEIDGVHVIKTCRQDSGIPILRFFYPRWSSLNTALKRANADVYYQNCGEYVTGQVALWCRSHNRKFVYSLASDMDADPELPVMKTMRERVLYKYGLSHADCVIAQTQAQRKMLEDGFGISSRVLPMPCAGPKVNEDISALKKESMNILWAGRIQPLKRLELLLEVAELLPEVEFYVAGNADGDDSYTAPLLSKMEELSNVFYLGMVSRERMPKLYQNATLLCCTSEYEGFPNTFLEAWSFGVPVVSTFDPDNMLDSLNLGVSIKNKQSLYDAIKKLSQSQGEWEKMSEDSRQYYLKNHSVDSAMARFAEVFEEVI